MLELVFEFVLAQIINIFLSDCNCQIIVHSSIFWTSDIFAWIYNTFYGFYRIEKLSNKEESYVAIFARRVLL